jgi:hypothetical protein
LEQGQDSGFNCLLNDLMTLWLLRKVVMREFLGTAAESNMKTYSLHLYVKGGVEESIGQVFIGQDSV